MFCADLPQGWGTALLGDQSLAADALRSNLLSLAGDNLNAVMIQVQPGKGNLNIQKTSAGSASVMPSETGMAGSTASSQTLSANNSHSEPDPGTPNTLSSSATDLPSSKIDSASPASRFARIMAAAETKPADEAPTTSIPTGNGNTPPAIERPRAQNVPAQPSRRPMPVSTTARSRPAAQVGRFVSPRSTSDLPEIKRPSAQSQGLYRGLAKIIQKSRLGIQKIAEAIKKFLPNLLPGLRENESEFTGSSLAFLAVAIPLIIVTIAGLVYTRYGRVTQYQENYNKALEQAAQAHGQIDPTEVRRAWDSTLYYLDLADNYQVTQDSQSLRQQAQAALDNLDGIVRLDFRPAIVGGLSHTALIDRLAATNTDLYLLDSSRGSVMRAVLSGQGYEVDPGFICGPGEYDSTIVGNLIDIEALQMSNIYNARVMALDTNGSLLYCGFNMDPSVIPLIPPALGWQGISAFSLDTDGKYLYVLDSPGNAVWVYQGNYGKFDTPPTMFFGEQVPQNMNTTIDLAANNSDLYLLFEDGHVTACPASHYEGVPMRCVDPVNFVDNRPERQPGPRITDAIFNQISFAAAPDPLLYLLEPLTRAVYYFSPRSDSLELRGQFRASVEQSNSLFDGPATAMTISPNHYIFFSTGNQVFFTTNVP